jgi:actin-like ATPase involved in cell morphogenesis
MRRMLEGRTLTRKPKTVAERIARAAIERAIRKSDRALDTVLDRTEGSVPKDITSGGEALISDAALLALLAKAKL